MQKESINNILFDFHSIIDTDIGIARIMNSKYNNPGIINPSILNKNTDDYKILMLNRKYCNPLVLFLNDSYRLEADGLYTELTKTAEIYQEILKMSIPTSIFDILKNSEGMPSLKTTVLCWTEQQADYLKTLLPNVNVLIQVDNTPIDVTEFDTLIFKYIYPNYMFNCGDKKEVNGKNIYICRYRFNMVENQLSKLNITEEVRLYHAHANIFYIIEVYADATLDAKKEEIE